MSLITLTMAMFYSSAPVSRDGVTVSQHAQYQDLIPKQLNEIQPSFILLVTPVLFPTVTRQSVFCEKGLLKKYTRNKIQRDRSIISAWSPMSLHSFQHRSIHLLLEQDSNQ